MRASVIKILSGMLFLTMTGCVSNDTNSVADSANNESAERQAYDYEDIELNPSEMKVGVLRDGFFIPVEELVQVTSGVERASVQSILGTPISNSTQNWWFYNINLPLGNADDYLVCQYRVAFQGDLVGNQDWRRPQCRALYEELVENLPSDKPVEPQRITLSSDVLFAYESASLSSAGERELDDVAYVISEEVQLTRVDIEGHADRTGGDVFNMELSERRARVVGNYLQSKGVSSSLINVRGRGFHDPVVSCAGNQVTEELKRCLQPNRRVEITINGVR
ncbi:MAG: OmpA family protein [Gammaproteobacteria bacterium]